MPAPPRTCGSCSLCCDLLAIATLGKPARTRCADCMAGQGCAIYEQRPSVCRDYACGWLLNPGLPDHWRPESCGMILGRSDAGIPNLIVPPDRRDAWRAEPFLSDLRRVAGHPETSAGGCVVIVCADQQILLYTTHEVHVAHCG